MDSKLSGPTCPVSGVSSDIGVGIAKVLASEDARVAMAARRVDRLKQLASEIGESGGPPSS